MKNIFIKIFLLFIFVINFWNVVNAAAPVIDDATFSVDENSAAGTVVWTQTWSDSDWDTITYDIISWNIDSAFSIDNNTAQITVSWSLDYETLNQYSLTIQATASWETDTWTITVNVINDITPPVFDSIVISSNNSKNSNFAKEWDKIWISLNINPADTWKSWNNGTFSIWATTNLNTWNFTYSNTPKTTRNKNYTVLSWQNGTLEFTDLDFWDGEWNSLTGFTAPYSSGFSITVDTIAPVINFADDIDAWPVQSDTLNITVSDLNTDTWSYMYAFTDDTTCTWSVNFTENFTSGADIIFNDESHNNKYICVKAEDAAGNVSYKVSSEKINIDITAPTILNSNIVSNNSNSWSWAKSWNEITLTMEFSEKVNSPEVMILNNTGSVILTQSGSSNIYFWKYITTNSDTQWIINYSINTTDIAWNSLVEVTSTTDFSQVIFDRTKPNFDMTAWNQNWKIDMEYKVYWKYDDPGTENISDNLSSSWSLFWKVVIVNDWRPAPGPNVSWNYSISYSLSDVAGNTKTLVRNVRVNWASSSKTKHMDVCNENWWDFSWDYYDWKCWINPKNEETKKLDNNEKKSEQIKKEETKKIEEKKDEIKYVKSDIEKNKVSEENVIKYKNILEKKYSKKVNYIKKDEKKVKIVVSRIDKLLINIDNYNLSDNKKKLIIEIVLSLKEILLNK